MTDVSHWFGSDLTLGPTGDIAIATSSPYVEQRLVRRLLTAAQTYIQNISYGAGLGQFVGNPTNAGLVVGVIKRQCALESTISQSPPPVVAITGDATGNLTATVTYADAATGQTQVATVPLG
jgi:hypothetical protein